MRVALEPSTRTLPLVIVFSFLWLQVFLSKIPNPDDLSMPSLLNRNVLKFAHPKPADRKFERLFHAAPPAPRLLRAASRPARRAACSPAARGGAGLGGCRPPSIALITMCCCISFILPVSLVHPLPLFLPRRPFYNFRANHETRAVRGGSERLPRVSCCPAPRPR